jgi:uncharacterized membrane protein YjjB (DUF3815 family)
MKGILTMNTMLVDVAYHGLLGLIATAGFAIWFNVPKDALLRVCAVGALGYVTRRVLIDLGHAPASSSFWAALCIGLVGYWIARRYDEPRVILSIPGIIPLVPGIPAYNALVSFFNGELTKGLENAVRATMIIGALAAGLIAARMLTMRRLSEEPFLFGMHRSD